MKCFLIKKDAAKTILRNATSFCLCPSQSTVLLKTEPLVFVWAIDFFRNNLMNHSICNLKSNIGVSHRILEY